MVDLRSRTDGELGILLLQNVDHWIAQYSKPFLFSKSFEDAKWDPVVCIHSSGSTGDPKLITLNNGYLSILDRPLREIPGRESPSLQIYNFAGDDGNYFTPIPPHHSSGFMAMSLNPIFFTATLVLALSKRPATGLDILQIIDHMPLKMLLAPPSLIEQAVKLPGGIERLETLEYLAFLGGPLSKDIGNRLCSSVRLISFCRSSYM